MKKSLLILIVEMNLRRITCKLDLSSGGLQTLKNNLNIFQIIIRPKICRVEGLETIIKWVVFSSRMQPLFLLFAYAECGNGKAEEERWREIRGITKVRAIGYSPRNCGHMGTRPDLGWDPEIKRQAGQT